MRKFNDVYVLRHTESGLYFRDFNDPTGNSIAELRFSDCEFQIFQTVEKLARIYVRIDQVRSYIEKHEDLTPGNQFCQKIENYIQIIREFDKTQVEVLQFHVKEQQEQDLISISDQTLKIRAHEYFLLSIGKVASGKQSKLKLIHQGFQKWKEVDNKNEYDHIVFVGKECFGFTNKNVRDHIDGLGIDPHVFDYDNNSRLMLLSRADLNLLVLSAPKSIVSQVEIKKMVELEKKVYKHFGVKPD